MYRRRTPRNEFDRLVERIEHSFTSLSKNAGAIVLILAVVCLVAMFIYGTLNFRPSIEERFGIGSAGPASSSETTFYEY